MAGQSPYCPPGWTCEFTPPAPPEHPWWESGATLPVLIVIGIFVVAALLWVLVDAITDQVDSRREAKDAAKERALARQHELALEEQHTMQLDAAQGNPDVLKLVRKMKS